MKITSKLSETYTPKFNGNRDLPETERVLAYLEYPTQEEWERYSGGDAVQVIRNHVKRIDNLEHNGQLVNDGKMLMKQVRGKLSDLTIELYQKFLAANRIEDDDEKNSEGQSSSS